jgi:biotin synthase
MHPFDYEGRSFYNERFIVAPTGDRTMHRSTEPTRHDWTREEIAAIYNRPLLELIFDAHTVHRRSFPEPTIQMCTLLSIKTGSCPEDCSYCPQSAHYETVVEKEPLLEVDNVLSEAKRAQEAGSTRFCMGAAWREVKDGAQFDTVVKMVEGVRDMGMEACVTLGMLNEEQAKRLKEAGLTSYNHNLDTSPEFYPSIITTRTYEDRLRTLRNVRSAGITVCSGGIIGLGESVEDRVGLLHELSKQDPHPESVPINALVPVEGTPMGGQEKSDGLQLARMIATARIIMPTSIVRLSAGRTELNDEAHALCFMAGANSIFAGDRLLTTPNPEVADDMVLLNKLGLRPMETGQLT